MNLSASVMLVNKAIRPVRVEYDPDQWKNNSPDAVFMTFDPAIKVDDLVIVPTHTRHGFTIVKVKEIDFAVDFQDTRPVWRWIGGRFDKAQYESILAQEKIIKDRIAKSQENKMRKELAEAMGLGEVDFTDLDVANHGLLPATAVPAPGMGQSAAPPVEAPTPQNSAV